MTLFCGILSNLIVIGFLNLKLGTLWKINHKKPSFFTIYLNHIKEDKNYGN